MGILVSPQVFNRVFISTSIIPENCVKFDFFFNSELGNFKCLRFYSTFQYEISSYSLKCNTFSAFTHVLLQKWLKLHEIINWSTPLLEFSTIFVTKKVKQKFLDYYKNPNISYLNHQIQVLVAWIYFKCSLLFNSVKDISQFHWIWKKMEKVHSKVESEKVHST